MTPEPGKNPVGRPHKSESYVKRSFRVILPDMVMFNEWKNLAKESGQSMSKFVIERVEEALRNNGEGSRYSRKELIDHVMGLEEQVRNLSKDLEIKSKAYDALERELQSLRVRPFLNPFSQGIRELSKNLVELFKSRKRVGYHELLPALEIKPTEIDTVKGINEQIEVLMQYGLIESDLKGWRWIE